MFTALKYRQEIILKKIWNFEQLFKNIYIQLYQIFWEEVGMHFFFYIYANSLSEHFTCSPYGALWDSLSATQANERQLAGVEYVVVVICCLQDLHYQGMVAWPCARSLVQWEEYWLSALPLASGLHYDCQKAASLAICWGEIPFPPCENGNILKEGKTLNRTKKQLILITGLSDSFELHGFFLGRWNWQNLAGTVQCLVVLGVFIYK